MLIEKEVQFRFKGSRDYVQGPDIYNCLLDTVNDNFDSYPSQIRGSFHRLLSHNGMLHIYSNSEDFNQELFYADFVLLFENEEYYAGLSNADTPIISSYEYDEEDVLSGLIFDQSTVKLAFKPSYSYIEQIIAMTKRLHFNLYPEVKEKWLFTKFRFQDTIDPQLFPDRELSVKAGKNFHNKLTQNMLALDNAPMGDIWFSSSEAKENE